MNINKKLLTLNEASKYINLSEEEILKIIYEEEKQIITSHGFTGRRFPYLKINDKYYVPKDLLDEWIKDASGKSY
ncbi:MAG: helix-turn-helix domain-containing protein [Caloramator sp.]|nr:helix-turn-helix domain-containing protein [Caloramator sp.]